MTKFDLEAALKGKDVITRDGRDVIEIKHFEKAITVFPIHAVIEDTVEIATFTEAGHFNNVASPKDQRDLFMK